MPTWLQIILGVLWLAWVIQALLCWMLAAKFAHWLDRPEKTYDQPYEPLAVVIVPFKGLEPNLRENVQSLCDQNYPAYRLMCVFESEDDPAVDVVREVLAKAEVNPRPCPWQIVIAGPAADNEGQKVHNLLTALAQAGRLDDQGVLVFADSDAVPDSHWLGRLITPLNRIDRTAVSTGYRWLIPRPGEGSSKPSFWAHLASILNSSAASFYARHRYQHAWGGSMAMRVETARRGDLRGKWQGAISDDYQVTALAHDLRMVVAYVPHCLVASPVAYDFRGFVNFARRQYIITKTHMPKLLLGSLLFQSLSLAGFVSAWSAMVYSIMVGGPSGWSLAPVGAILGVFIFHQLRATARRLTIGRAFGDEMAGNMQHTLWIDRWLTPVWAGIHLAIVLSACVGRTIRWRGYRYRIDGPHSVRRLAG